MTSMSKTTSEAPTSTGEWSGRDVSCHMTWSFESPHRHWAEHDERQMAYSRSRSADHRLAQTGEYRRRRHGDAPEPAAWSWRLIAHPFD
jgi:hypothetical protein